MKVQKSVEVEQKADELGAAICAFVKVIKEQLKDGFQVGNDVPPIVAEALKDLVVIVNDAGALPLEAKEDAFCFAKTLGLAGFDIGAVLAAK